MTSFAVKMWRQLGTIFLLEVQGIYDKINNNLYDASTAEIPLEPISRGQGAKLSNNLHDPSSFWPRIHFCSHVNTNFGRHAFAYSSPAVWNSIHLHTRQSPS